MKPIHCLTEIFSLIFREHKFECLKTTFRLEIRQLNYSLRISCLGQIKLPYFLKVNAHLWIEILLIKKFFVLWFDKIISLNHLFFYPFIFLHFLFLLILLFKFIDLSLFALLLYKIFIFILLVFLIGLNFYFKINGIVFNFIRFLTFLFLIFI